MCEPVGYSLKMPKRFLFALVFTATFAACSSSDNWTDEEVENAQHLYASQEANAQKTRILNAGSPGSVSPEDTTQMIELDRTALSHAQQVRDDVLAKAHPELPRHFREDYQRSLELSLEVHDWPTSAAEDNMKSIQSGLLHDRWVAWWNENMDDIRIPLR